MMKTITARLLRKSLLATAAIVLSTSVASFAHAQSSTVTVSVGVQNTMDLTVTHMNFGSFAIAGGYDADTPGDSTYASVLVSPSGAITVSNTGTPAYSAIHSTTGASQGAVAIADAAPNATVSVNIGSVVNPVNALSSQTLTLGGFRTQAVGEASPTNRTPGTPFNLTIGNDGTQTLSIGASLTTGNRLGMYASGVYAGSFAVVFSY